MQVEDSQVGFQTASHPGSKQTQICDFQMEWREVNLGRQIEAIAQVIVTCLES